MLQWLFVACSAAIAFAATDLLAYSRLSDLLSGRVRPSRAAFIFVSVTSLFWPRSGEFGKNIEVAVVYGSLLSLAVVDLRSGYVPNVALVPLIVLECVQLFLGGDIFSGVFGSMVVGGVALALHVVGKGTSFGLGDVKLLALLGGIFGASRSLTLLAVACIIGAAIGLMLFVLGVVSRRDAIPFVPMLGLAYLWQVVTHGI